MKKITLLLIGVLISVTIFSQTIDQQLVQAAYDGNESKVNNLLSRGANPNAVDNNGYSAIIYASAYGYQGIMKALIRKKARVNIMYNGVYPILAAVNNNNTSSIQILLAAGATVNCEDENGYTPLMFAAQEGYVESVEYLLQNGAEINAQTYNGHTALSIAIQNGHTNVVKTILKYSPRKSGYSSKVHSPLNTANHFNKKTEKRLLKNYGMKKQFGLPTFQGIFFRLGPEFSLYDMVYCYGLGIHESTYNFDIYFDYSAKGKNDSLIFIYTKDNNIYQTHYNFTLGLTKNFNIISSGKNNIGISISGFGASYYGHNDTQDNFKTQFLYGACGGIYASTGIFGVRLDYKRVLTPNSYFGVDRLQLTAFLKIYNFKSSNSKYIFADKTLDMI